MLALERQELLLDIKDRMAALYVQKDEAGKSGDWALADAIKSEILEVKAQRAEIHDRDMPENP